VRPLAVGFISASTLAYEILLVRILGIEHFHHFAYMIIGVAMLGVGVSGTFLALIRLPTGKADPWFRGSAVLTSVALMGSAALLHWIPLDAAQLPWDPRQWLRLALVYVCLAAPFAVGGLAVLLALSLDTRRAGRLYGASFAGAAAGAALAVSILWVAFPERALAVPAGVAAVGGLFAVWPGRGRALTASGFLLAVLAAAAIVAPPWQIRVTPYKGLPQVEAFPGARRVAERTSPVGWVVAVEAPAFRFAPGLSLSYRGEFPRQTALFVDGDIVGALTGMAAESDAALFEWLPASAPYAMGGRRSVLVLGAGSGVDVRGAVSQGAARVRAVELHPEVARLARLTLPETSGAEVGWAVGDARGYVATNDQRFDLITIAAGSGIGAASAGVHALNEDFLHTVDAAAAREPARHSHGGRGAQRGGAAQHDRQADRRAKLGDGDRAGEAGGLQIGRDTRADALGGRAAVRPRLVSGHRGAGQRIQSHR
jgi:hypothetical protein